MTLEVARLPEPALEVQRLEIVERKGIGHPDTICDALAEAFSARLSRWYLEHFGFVAHHNVDKVLLRGGVAAPAFGGGEVVEPIAIYLAGRATSQHRGVRVPVEDIARDACSTWLAEHLHALDVSSHVRLHVITHPGSPDLVDLFMRQREGGALLANDTSCGVGSWPPTPLERAVLEVELTLNARGLVSDHPEYGEDVKVMGLRTGGAGSLTVSRAMIGRYLHCPRDYHTGVARLAETAAQAAARVCDTQLSIAVNAADAPDQGAVFLTVTGTSAEGGDDGQTGRGNRPGGLAAAYRPTSMEAAAGKNPVTHVGKLYGIASRAIARRVVEEVEEIEAADCALVSRIGRPVSEPQLTSLRLRLRGQLPPDAVRPAVEEIAQSELAALATAHERILAGDETLY